MKPESSAAKVNLSNGQPDCQPSARRRGFGAGRTFPDSGFTLLEVMFALVILAMSLIVLMQNQTQSVSLAERARGWDHATALASAKIAELSMIAQQQGIEKVKNEETGEFDQAKFPGYRWKSWTRPVPQPNFQALAGLASAENEEENPSAGAMAGPMQMIAKAWNECLTELHVEITWGEGQTPRSFELTTHLLAKDTSIKIQGIVGALGAGLGGQKQQ